jgi:sugar/nucleoside kinase (ribokinase family)
VKAVDTLGAGDVFHGALAAALAVHAADLPGCIDLAAQVAAVRCSRLGSRAWLEDPALEAMAARLRPAAAAGRGRGAAR